MNLPYPFESAQDIRPDAFGRIALVDEGDKVLALVPLATAHGIAPKQEYPSDRAGCKHGYGWGYESGEGSGFGFGYGYNFDTGEGRGK
jgi:catalase (peroxidase I)